jgi:hypothetical protein
MKDREPLKALAKFVKWSHREPICLLHNCPLDDIVVLILYKAPLKMNESPNNLILYYYDNLNGLCDHFKKYKDCLTEKSELFYALEDILRLLYIEWAKVQDKNTDKSFLG